MKDKRVSEPTPAAQISRTSRVERQVERNRKKRKKRSLNVKEITKNRYRASDEEEGWLERSESKRSATPHLASSQALGLLEDQCPWSARPLADLAKHTPSSDWRFSKGFSFVGKPRLVCGTQVRPPSWR
jgi:hypothetical protein